MGDWKQELNKWIAYPDLDISLKKELETLLSDPEGTQRRLRKASLRIWSSAPAACAAYWASAATD